MKGYLVTIDDSILNIGTPSYVFFWKPVQKKITELKSIKTKIPFKHFFSFKTAPVLPLIRNWANEGLPVEVVSEFEYLAARRIGIPPTKILINGPRKCDWLNKVEPGSWIHIDSHMEAEYILRDKERFRQNGLGIRIAVEKMVDPDDPGFSGQFGVVWEDAKKLYIEFKRYNLALESIHFHLQSNVPAIEYYRHALSEVVNNCRTAGWTPSYIDIGGGAPASIEHPRDGMKTEWNVSQLIRTVDDVVHGSMPLLHSIWMENGRNLLADCGILILTVKDIKENRGCRYLICDGGRVNNALVSDWNRHQIDFFPKRGGEQVLTSICGPTCMAWDWIDRGLFPREIQVGDRVIWHGAGAYHLPFATMFSHGFGNIVWVDSDNYPYVVRDKQCFEEWFSALFLPT